MAHTSDLGRTLAHNEERLFVFPLEGLEEEWRQRKLRTAHKLAGYVAPARDSFTVFKICRELGIFGRVAVTTAPNGRSYVIVKGHPGVRSVLTGTRYLESNVRVVKLAIGRIGLVTSVTEGAILTIVLYVGIDVLEYILEDHVTLSMLSANLATDLMKVGISAIAGATMGLAVGGLTTVAAGPLVAAITVGSLVGWALDEMDRKYGVTAKLADAIEDYGEKLAKKHEEIQRTFDSLPHEIERGLIWRMYRWDIDNPIGF